MLISQKHDLIMEITNILISIYDKLETNLIFNNKEIYTETAFINNGFLPMFLYNKQKFIDKFCNEELSDGTFIHFNYSHNNHAYLALNAIVSHNISNELDYQKTLKFISLLILQDPNLAIGNQEIDLSPYYENFLHNFNQSIH